MSIPCEPIYYPDFVLWNKGSNLLIDIEIDEPYTAIDKKPIHYEDPSRNNPDLLKSPTLRYFREKDDSDRDRDFLLKFWIVVRFTERQVIETPKNCCFLIKEIRDTILNHGNLDSVDIEKVPREDRWDFIDAKAMAQNNSRNNYLPMHLKIHDSLKNSKENTKDSSDSEDFLPF